MRISENSENLFEDNKVGRQKRQSSVTPDVVVSLRNGRHEAFDAVYLYYKKPVTAFIGKLIGSADDTEEIVQEVFVNVWAKREQIDPGKNIRNYLFTIAKNTALKRLYRNNVLDRGLDGCELDIPETADTEAMLRERDITLLVEIAVSRMPEMRRRVFELYRCGNMSNEDIASELNISKENAQKHLSRARKDIKDLLAVIVFFLMPC